MKVKCIKEFSVKVLVFDITYLKDEEYEVKEVNDQYLLEAVIGNIDFLPHKDNFEII